MVEAERRGYRVETPSASEPSRYGRSGWTGPRDGHVEITVSGCSTALRISEEGIPSRAHRVKKNQTWDRWGGREGRWKLPPRTEYEAGATGRLKVEIVSGFGESGRPVKWADRKSWTLEEKLPELLREIGLRAVEQQHRRQAAEREATEREKQWELAMAKARERWAEARRGGILRDEAGRWRDAEALRSYCDAAESAYPDDLDTAEWISWARAYADSLDLLREPPRAPAVPESVPAVELRPYLEGWDPYGPTRNRW